MPGKTDARLKVLRGGGDGLPVIAQAQFEREVRFNVERVLHKCGQPPLRQIITTDPEIDWLLIILHIRQRQLIKWQRGSRAGAQEGKGSQDGGAGLTAGAARLMMHNAAAKFEIVRTLGPGQGVGKLVLMTPKIREA